MVSVSMCARVCDLHVYTVISLHLLAQILHRFSVFVVHEYCPSQFSLSA